MTTPTVRLHVETGEDCPVLFIYEPTEDDGLHYLDARSDLPAHVRKDHLGDESETPGENQGPRRVVTVGASTLPEPIGGDSS